ncbi:MAG: beta-galactosidase [Ignavibacteriales bacterium]|nr:beta-galactosidase [Ignavibacteriales bacterium]
MSYKFILKSFIVITVSFLFSCTSNNSENYPIKVEGVNNPIINIDGTWKFSMNQPKDFWTNDISFDNWQDIQVPGECAMQGFPIKHDIPYVYKTQINIPTDYKDKIIKLKFDGVYSYSKVWVNGNFVREHKGGFTAWECNITDFVKPGNTGILTVEITDKKDDLSYGSGYAKHQIGGILRSVWLIALPNNYLSKLYVETDLDNNYQDAILKIFIETNLSQKAFIEFKLFNSENEEIILENSFVELNNLEDKISLKVTNPKKWDAEHPNLYTLQTDLYDANKNLTFSKTQNIGFRKIEIAGNKMLVNGKLVKLRGACRHDIHPTLGRTTTPEYDLEDVLLAKEANMNFIRTSHYPPSEAFLDYCDQYGIYVEDESAVCFVNTHRMKGYNEVKQSGKEFEDQFLSQVNEMVHYHRNHPSVILWSIGNESKYDEQFQKSYDYIKSVDSTRPVIASYPGLVPDTVKCYDILSMHYPSYTGDIWPQYGIGLEKFEYEKMPALFDEWAHVACYNQPTLRTDPYVREFWGKSLDSMWMNLFESEAGLGGAIWGYIDETFMMPENMKGFDDWWGIQELKGEEKVYRGPTIGYGEWGIIDTWRRKKPEFWNTKKAYSPTKILIKEITDFTQNKGLNLPVYNRFDHTNLNEIKIVWEYENDKGEITNLDIKPHEKGELIIPGNNWKKNKFLSVEFLNEDNSLIDKYQLRIGKRDKKLFELKFGNIKIAKEKDFIKIIGKNYSGTLNLKTGLLENLISNNDTLIKSGPYLNILIFDKGDWATVPFYSKSDNWDMQKTNYSLNDGILIITTKGHFEDNLTVEYEMHLDENGLINIEYSASNLPKDKLIREAGLKFYLGNNFTNMNWDRDSYWTTYPDNHLGMSTGDINLSDSQTTEYRQFPNHIWEKDINDFYYQGLDYQLPLSKLALSTKENIYSFGLKTNNITSLNVYDSGKKACRLEISNGNWILNINDQWDYASLKWGNYQKNIKFKNQFKGSTNFEIQ